MFLQLIVYFSVFTYILIISFKKTLQLIKIFKLKNINNYSIITLFHTSFLFESVPVLKNKTKIDLFTFFFSCILIAIFNIPQIIYCMEDQEMFSSGDDLSSEDESSLEGNFEIPALVPLDFYQLPLKDLVLDIQLGINTDASGVLAFLEEEKIYFQQESLLYLSGSPFIQNIEYQKYNSIAIELMQELDNILNNIIEFAEQISVCCLDKPELINVLTLFEEQLYRMLIDSSNLNFKINFHYWTFFENNSCYNSSFFNKISPSLYIDDSLSLNIKKYLSNINIARLTQKNIEFYSFILYLQTNIFQNIQLLNLNGNQPSTINIANINDNFILPDIPHKHMNFNSYDTYPKDLNTINFLINKGFKLRLDTNNLYYRPNGTIFLFERNIGFPRVNFDNSTNSLLI